MTVYVRGGGLALWEHVGLDNKVTPHIRPSWYLDGQIDHLGMIPATRPGHPAIDRHNEYQQKLGTKQAHHVIHSVRPADPSGARQACVRRRRPCLLEQPASA